MDRSSASRLVRRWLLRPILALAALLVLLAAVVAVGERHLKDPLVRFLSARTGRQIRIDGAFEAHLLSLHPGLSAGDVVIGNPPWVPPGVMAKIGRLSLEFARPQAPHWVNLRRLEMDGATFYLTRDRAAHANWQWTPPDKGAGSGPPFIRSLFMPGARVEVDDAPRHLQFSGIVSAGELRTARGPPLLRIDGAGRLNGKAATFAVNGDPLWTARWERPYRFAFDEHSSGSRLQGRGSIAHPFDFRVLDTDFQATGADMRDLYFLAGMTLPDTGRYRLTGRFSRRNTQFRFDGLAATSGQSDMSGTFVIDGTSRPARVKGDLRSQWLLVSDIGPRAAGRAAPSTPQSPLLPEKPLPLTGIRHSDAVIHFHARGLGVGRSALHSVSALVRIDRGVLSVTSLNGDLAGGSISGRLRFDATRETPRAELDLAAAGLQLAQVDRQRAASWEVDGALSGRLHLEGRGKSLHEIAGTADGTVTTVLPHGDVRASLAELTGLDLSRELGLMLGKSHEQTPIRCGIASFDARAGVLDARTLVVDTDKVLITGSGAINLDSETLDLALRGRPKTLRLVHVRSPVAIRGSLRHPTVAIDARHVAAQTGAAVALGVVLTPLAAVLAFVDPGLAKDADCASLLAEAGAGAGAGRDGTASAHERH